MDIKITQYTLYEVVNNREVFITVEWAGCDRDSVSDRWAIRRGERVCWCTCADAFVMEPLPSARDEEFFSTTRFPLSEAIAIAIRAFENEKKVYLNYRRHPNATKGDKARG